MCETALEDTVISSSVARTVPKIKASICTDKKLAPEATPIDCQDIWTVGSTFETALIAIELALNSSDRLGYSIVNAHT